MGQDMMHSVYPVGIAHVSHNRYNWQWFTFWSWCTFKLRGHEILAYFGNFVANLHTSWCIFYKPE